jgi:4-amino-4-deoxy-L-arabinose transferase-like glycosyltransferase
VALYLLQVAFSLDARSLWYSDEVRYAGAYRSMVDSGNWLVMHLDGAVYPDKPPLFFWFLRGLDEAVKALMPLAPFSVTVTETMLFFAGAALSGLLCLVAAHALASLVARVDRRTVLAADLILVSGFFFAALAHYLRMDFLFTACITLSHVFLFHAWVRDRAPLLMALGFLFAGAAVLVKGPLGLALPLLTGPCFLIWQGRFPRFFRPDFLCGLIAGLAVPGVWLALAYLDAGDAFVNNILHKQVLARALDAWHHAEPWYHYLATFPLIWLPWTPALLFLPWGRFMNKEMREGLAVSRTRDGAGIAYCWCAVLSGFVLLSLVSIKLPVYCLPLFPPAAILCARAVLRMRPFAAACLQYSLALLLLVLGLGLVLMPAVPGDYLPLPYVPKGVTALSGICLFFACAFAFLVKPRRGEGVILFTAVFTTVFMYPAWTATAPSLDAFLSPRAQAGVLKTYMDAGYFPAAFKVYPGTYTYYAGNVRECPNWEDVLARMEANPKMVLATRASLWDKMENRPEGFVEAHRQTIAEREYVLAARPPLAGTAELPADAPEAAFPEAVRPPAAEGSGESPAASVPEPSHPAAEPASPGTGAPAGP